MRSWNKISRIQDGVEIPGMLAYAFIHNGSYFVSDIKIYQDGLIDCWDKVDLEGFKQKIRQGWVVTKLPNNAHVSISPLVHFTATEVKTFVKEDEFVKEVADVLEELNGRPTSLDQCREAFQRFQNEQSEEAIQRLEEAFEAVPEHLRFFVVEELKPSIDVDAAFRAFKRKSS